VKIALIQGHPDERGGHFCHALAEAYVQAAKDAAHEVRTVEVAALDFPLLRRAEDWNSGAPVAAIAAAQATVKWAQHLVIVFPLWMGDMPALLKAFFEQLVRPGFAIGPARPRRLHEKLLKGRSARLIVTMGMPAFFYRLYYRSHSVKSLQRNVLEMCGISPVRSSLIGTVEDDTSRRVWLAKLQDLGRAGR
jgi:putative NADPH-quinone reductase